MSREFTPFSSDERLQKQLQYQLRRIAETALETPTHEHLQTKRADAVIAHDDVYSNFQELDTSQFGNLFPDSEDFEFIRYVPSVGHLVLDTESHASGQLSYTVTLKYLYIWNDETQAEMSFQMQTDDPVPEVVRMVNGYFLKDNPYTPLSDEFKIDVVQMASFITAVSDKNWAFFTSAQPGGE